MRKSLPLLVILPLLTACEDISVPFVAPLEIPMEGVSDKGVDGLFRLNAASEAMTLDELRDSMPAMYQDVEDFTVTSLVLSDPGMGEDLIDPEYDELIDPEYDELIDPEYDELIDPEYDELSDFAINAAIYISLDDVLDQDDKLLAWVDEFENDEAHYEAEVTDHAQLSQHEEGAFHVIVTATFNIAPPENLNLPLLISGNGTISPSDVLQ
jgi:hypothetical protein